jgi:hypothetical protein
VSGGVLALCANEQGRFSECYASIMGIRRPPDSRLSVTIGGSIAKAWNDVGEYVMDSGAEWLMLLNDDHVYPPETLEQLLAHDVDMVTGFYLHRSFPFAPVLYDRLAPQEDGQNWYHHYQPRDEESGLVPIVGCGDGCVLIRRRVLERIPMPIWEISKFKADMQSTDLIFCEKVREQGFQIWADLDLRIGHMIIAPVFPDKTTGQWRTVMLQRGGIAISLPALPPQEGEGNADQDQSLTSGAAAFSVGNQTGGQDSGVEVGIKTG